MLDLAFLRGALIGLFVAHGSCLGPLRVKDVLPGEFSGYRLEVEAANGVVLIAWMCEFYPCSRAV